MTIEDLIPMGDYLLTYLEPVTTKGVEGAIISTTPTVYYKVISVGTMAEKEGISVGDFVSIKSGSQYEVRVGNEKAVVFPYHQVITVLDKKFADELIPMETYLAPLQNTTAIIN